MDLLKALNSDGMTIVMVTHNSECAQYAGRILRLADGLLVEEERVGKNGGNLPPLSEKERKLMAAANLF
jgi:energy-coupling factor transporter ATP-binding protein EcfA2